MLKITLLGLGFLTTFCNAMEEYPNRKLTDYYFDSHGYYSERPRPRPLDYFLNRNLTAFGNTGDSSSFSKILVELDGIRAARNASSASCKAMKTKYKLDPNKIRPLWAMENGPQDINDRISVQPDWYTQEDLTLVEAALQKGADPNSDEAPLAYAVIFGKIELAKLLLRYGANPNINKRLDKTAFQWAHEKDHWLLTEEGKIALAYMRELLISGASSCNAIIKKVEISNVRSSHS